MVIGHGKAHKEVVLCIFIYDIILLIGIYTGAFGEDVGICYFMIIFFLLFALEYWAACGKTLIMNEEGCTVCLLWYRKNYRWEELQVKRIEDYRPGSRVSCEAVVVFSPRRIHKPRRLDPRYYNLVHPLSFFFVSFWPDDRPKIPNRYSGQEVYEIDEDLFMEKMKQWNVELEDVRKKRKK